MLTPKIQSFADILAGQGFEAFEIVCPDKFLDFNVWLHPDLVWRTYAKIYNTRKEVDAVINNYIFAQLSCLFSINSFSIEERY